MFPDFLVIGAQKAGTTWLYRNLRVHPQVWMPEEKELHYFDEKIHARGGPLARLRGDRPEDLRWRRQAKTRVKKYRRKFSWERLGWDLKYFLREPNDEWYASLFDEGKGRIVGETTPDYSALDPEAIARVHELMPEAGIIFLMRNPVERAWSAADMKFRLTGRSIEEMRTEEFRGHLANKRMRIMTAYRRTIDNWRSYYPEDRVFVGFLEDIHFFPDEFLRRVYEFLGADPSVEYRVISRKIHSGSTEKMPVKTAAYLAQAYRKELEGLERRFGGYASFWRYCADRLAEDPPDGDHVSYPLWESSLWRDWTENGRGSPGANEARPQSGPLSTLRAGGS